MSAWTRTVSKRALAVTIALATAALGVTVLRAQGQNDRPQASLADVASELKNVRVAVEELARSQTQTQALGVYLSAEQSRLAQVTDRLDTARRDLDGATARLQEVDGNLSRFTEALARTTDANEHSELERAIDNVKNERKRIDVELQQARLRESELAQSLQVEEARWNELISRLEQLVKR